MNRETITLNSHAKINLFLRVLNKRSDGYYNVQMVIAPLELHDIITVTKSDKDSLCSYNPLVPLNQNNLCMQALKLLRTHYPQISSIAIDINKVIPIAAGLGGGSSNAATLIQTLIKLFNLKISLKQQLAFARH